MAGGHVKHRMMDRPSAHRQQLLRNLVTCLFQLESISTTWPRAKETQRLAEKLVTLAKRNTAASKQRAQQILYSPLENVPRLFDTIRQRYANRPGGYTRILRIEPKKTDQAPSAILELVDGPRDMRFALTAQTVARDRMLERPHSAITMQNKEKVTRFRENGIEEFEKQVQKFVEMEESDTETPEPRKIELRQIPEEKPDAVYMRKHKHMKNEQYKRTFIYGSV